jgi:hypothetical protein
MARFSQYSFTLNLAAKVGPSWCLAWVCYAEMDNPTNTSLCCCLKHLRTIPHRDIVVEFSSFVIVPYPVCIVKYIRSTKRLNESFMVIEI